MKKLKLHSVSGFTLIELLVVIAIIGILASIILVSLGGVREKANDAKIISQVSSLRSAMEMYAGEHGNSYSGINDGIGSDDQSGLYELAADGSNYPDGVNLACLNGCNHGGGGLLSNDEGTAWLAFHPLSAKDSTGNSAYVCSDSRGRVKTYGPADPIFSENILARFSNNEIDPLVCP